MVLSKCKQRFFASNLFATQLEKLYSRKKSNETLKDLYPELLAWTAKNQSKNKLPVLVLPKMDSIYMVPGSNQIGLNFSTGLRKDFEKISCIVMELANGRATQERSLITILPSDITKWMADHSFVLRLNIPYQEFALIFNWWGYKYPVLSGQGIMLLPQSYILLRKL